MSVKRGSMISLLSAAAALSVFTETSRAVDADYLSVNKRMLEQRASQTARLQPVWVIRLQQGEAIEGLVRRLGLRDIEQVGRLRNVYRFRVDGSTLPQKMRQVERWLSDAPEVAWFEQQVARWQMPKVTWDPGVRLVCM